jgi:hypothetical protein
VTNGIFALGKTSTLLGASLARLLEGETNLANVATNLAGVSPGGLGLSGGASKEVRHLIHIEPLHPLFLDSGRDACRLAKPCAHPLPLRWTLDCVPSVKALPQASLVLLDRSLDLSTPLARDLDSLLQKIVNVLPRSGKRKAAAGGVVDEQVGLEDVGVNPPHLLPVLDKYVPFDHSRLR